MPSYNIRLSVIAFPAFLIVLQMGGCVREVPEPPEPGGTYRSTSAGAYFDQSVRRADEPGGNISSSTLYGAERPDHSPQHVYVAAAGHGVVVSKDGGESWRQLPTPLTNVTDVVALSNGVIVIAGVSSQGQGLVMRSIDEAKSWETTLTIPIPVETRRFQFFRTGASKARSTVVTIEADPFHADRVYAGSSLGNVLVGEQSAKTWRTIHTLTSIFSNNRQRLAVQEIVASPHTDGEMLVLTTEGSLWRVSEGRQEEIKIPRELGGATRITTSGHKKVFDATYIRDFPQALFAGTDDGAVISRDGGGSWVLLALPIDAAQRFNTATVAVSPTNSARMFVAINSVVYRSEDGGKNWNTFSLQLPRHGITSLLIDPQNAANVLAVTTPLE